MWKSKNILFFVLAVIILLPVAAPFLSELKISHSKKAAAERLEKEHLQTLLIAAAEIYWVKSSKEIVIGKRFFDVKEYHADGIFIVVTGVFDNEETAVQKQADDLWHQQKNKQGIFLLKAFQVLANTYFNQHNDYLKAILQANTIYAKEAFYPETNIFINIPYPPPRV